jgi:hypothetical protein
VALLLEICKINNNLSILEDFSVDGDNISIDFGMLEMMKKKIVWRYFSPKFAQDTIRCS